MTHRATVAVLFLLPALALAQPGPAADDRPKEDPAVKARLDRKLPEVRFDGVGLADAVDFLRDVTGANVFVDWAALENAGVKRTAPVSLDLRDVPFRTALDKLAEAAATPKAKLGWATDDGVVVLTTALAARNPGAHVTGQLPDNLDKRLPEVNFHEVSMSDTVDFLRDVTGAKLVVNWAALEAAGIRKDTPVTLRLREAKFSTVLRFLLRSAGDGATPRQFTHADGVITLTATPRPPAGK